MSQPLRASIFSAALLSLPVLHSQTITPYVVATAGGTFTAPGVQLDQTLGEPVNTSLSTGGLQLDQGFQPADQSRLQLSVRVFLQGPFDMNLGRMRDALRAAGYLPTSEPYSAMGFTQVSGGGESVTPGIFDMTGPNAIVDWVLIELRDPADVLHVIATRDALLRSTGDVVDVDGSTTVSMSADPGPYYVCVRHRNHLPVLSLNAIAFSTSQVVVDFTNGSVPTYGTNAQQAVGSVWTMWAGDANSDRQLKYTGIGNDRDPLLVNVGSITPNNITTGYSRDDVNMDGTVRYTGTNNDRDVLLQNIGGTTPNNVRLAQLP